MRPVGTVVREQQGMTLVELMVAVTILMTGIIGVMTMSDIGNRNSTLTNQRIGATNLSREIVEAARGIEYERLTPAFLVSELQRRPGLEGTGTPWQLVRRNTTYTVEAQVCTYDDPKDGIASSPPANACPGTAVAPAGAPAEVNPDDFRRVSVAVSWQRDGQARTMRHSEMLVNPSGSLGPRITSFPQPAGQVSTGTSLPMTVATTSAAAVRWRADDGRSSGDASGGPTEWQFEWALGSDPTAPSWVVDGVYTVTAQAVDSRNIPGDARFATVLLNRNPPFQVSASGGRNDRFGGIVDIRWSRSAERDIREYRLYRIDAAGPVLICTRGVSAHLACTDTTPPAGELQYAVVAVDREDLGNPASALREGTPTELPLPAAADTAPEAPVPSSVAVEEGLPKFTWTQPAGATPIYYRIYRMAGNVTTAPGLADRYAITANADPFWRDPTPLSGTATYWFSAVGATHSESPVSTAVVYG